MARNKSQVHYNKVLTDIAVDFKPPELVATQVLPVKTVMMDTDVWPVFDKAMFDEVEDIRADGDEANEVSRGWKYEPYVIEEHALKEAITDGMRRNWDGEVDLESSSAEYLKQLVWNRYEIRVFGSSGLLRTAGNNIYSANTDWTNLTSATPRANVNAAINAIEDAAGLSPNTIVMTKAVARHLMNTSEWKEENKYTVNLSTQGGCEDLPDKWYGMKAVYVASLINTAKKGQPRSLTKIMGEDVWIGYVDPSGPGYRTLTYGATLMTKEGVRKWFNEDRKTDLVEYEALYCPKRIARECGALLTSVLTA